MKQISSSQPSKEAHDTLKCCVHYFKLWESNFFGIASSKMNHIDYSWSLPSNIGQSWKELDIYKMEGKHKNGQMQNTRNTTKHIFYEPICEPCVKGKWKSQRACLDLRYEYMNIQQSNFNSFIIIIAMRRTFKNLSVNYQC